jgi:alkanesulfonate monooxygenase SsuD/methylene tetrahydromethanopterin reductase-like flavin-dependent oxidoreductase (luciferase family)
VNAGQSPRGRVFAAKHADFSFISMDDHDMLRDMAAAARNLARDEYDRELGILTHCYVVCRDTEREAREYYEYYVDRCGDWASAEELIKRMIGREQRSIAPERLTSMQRSFIAGWAGYPLVGTPQQIVAKIQGLAGIGIDGAAMHWVDYEDGLGRFNEQILPLMEEAGLRYPA